MALTLAINSANIASVSRSRTLRISKQGSVETAVLTIQDQAKAYRPSVGDVFYADQDGTQLEMGGEITRVVATLQDTEWETKIHIRGWAFEADEIEVDLFTVPSSTVLGAAASSLCVSYLGGKGWTSLMGTGDGPYVAPGTYRAMTVGAILDDWTDQTDVPWRVNGEREFGFNTGTLAAPTSFTESNRTVIKGAAWSQDRVRLATRLKAVTAAQSADYFSHVEAHAANGIKTVFPVNALPQEVEATVTADYAIGVSTLAVANLPGSITLRSGLTLRAAAHGPYTLSAAAIVDGSGNATLALASPLVAAMVAEEGIAIDNGALVGLFVNSTTTALDGSAGWGWNPILSQLVASSAPSSTATIRYVAQLRHPVTVRSWVAGTQDSTGAFTASSIRDARVARAGDVDLAQTHARNLTDLARRIAAPKTFTFETDYVGHLYPWMYATVSFPSHGISGTYRIQDVEIVDVGRSTQRPRMAVTMVEGHEPDWRTDWKTNLAVAGTAGSRAGTISGGGSSGSGSSTAGVYVGLSLPLGGSNTQILSLTTSWQDISEAIPIDHPDDVTGTWSFRPCAYTLNSVSPAVPIQLRLLIDGTPVSSVSTSAYGSIVATANYGYPSASYSAPPAGACLVQARVASLTAYAVVGQSRTTKTA